MTSHRGHLGRIACVSGIALCLASFALRCVLRAPPVVVAFCLFASLLGCGAAPAVAHGPWARELPSGVRVFRVCRRHPAVNPKATYWYEEGDGKPQTALVPIEEILESSTIKAVFIHDPHAPPESRKILGIAHQDLPCDEPPPLPPPPKRIAVKKAPEREKAPRAEPPKKKAQTTVRTVMRRRLPDRRFLGQTAPTPAPTPARKVPDPPPPAGKTYAEQKASLLQSEAEAEARRTGERIGRRWGDTLGRFDEVKATYDRIWSEGYAGMVRRNPAFGEQQMAKLAEELNAVPDLPEYDDPRLAQIAWEAFLKGYGKGWADAELKFAIVNNLADGMQIVLGGAVAGLETAGARALRAAQQRLRAMPVFVPSAAGGPGGFLRRPKVPSPPALSPPKVPNAVPKAKPATNGAPKAATPPTKTTITTTVRPNGYRTKLAKATGKNPADAQAHHVFPIAHRKNFAGKVDIDDPRYGTWWDTAQHGKKSYAYNLEWKTFFDANGNATTQQILAEGRRLAKKYGFGINF